MFITALLLSDNFNCSMIHSLLNQPARAKYYSHQVYRQFVEQE